MSAGGKARGIKRGAIVALVGLLLLAGVAAAASGGSYILDWFTVDGGGALDLSGQTELTGLQYTLGGTAGQADAGLLAGGGYTLGGGFWAGGDASPPEFRFYLPLLLRS